MPKIFIGSRVRQIYDVALALNSTVIKSGRGNESINTMHRVQNEVINALFVSFRLWTPHFRYDYIKVTTCRSYVHAYIFKPRIRTKLSTSIQYRKVQMNMARLSLAVAPFLCFLLFSRVCAGKLHIFFYIYYACTIIIVNILHVSVCACVWCKSRNQRDAEKRLKSHRLELMTVKRQCVV